MGNSNTTVQPQQVQEIELEKSSGDLNNYHMFDLDNGVKVLLVDDKNQTSDHGDAIAFCSIVVNAGSLNDPKNRQGMAHFMEHMIFMGSKKYKKVDGYSQHMASHGGYCNAYTEFEITNYQF